jgi:hypothetical protein
MASEEWVKNKMREYRNTFYDSIRECYEDTPKDIINEKEHLQGLLKGELINLNQYKALSYQLDEISDFYNKMCDLDISNKKLQCDNSNIIMDMLIEARIEAENKGEGEEDDLASQIFDIQNRLTEYDYICKEKKKR